MSYLIRPTIEADVGAIREIYAEAVEFGTASFELTIPTMQEMIGRFHTLHDQGYPYFTLLEEDEILGYAYVGPYRTRPAYRWCIENSVYLDKKARGKGYGKLLLKELVNASTELGFRQMIAVIGDSQNKSSIAIHYACGFEMIGTLKAMGWKHEKWTDTVYMQLALGKGGEEPAELESLPGRMGATSKTG